MNTKNDFRKHSHRNNKLYDYAKCLAAVKDASWAKVNIIFSLCPKVDTEEKFSIFADSLDCIIALGTYFIRSKFQHHEKILPYLLKLLSGLKEAKWLHGDETSDILYAESFSFCLNTLLSEISGSATLKFLHKCEEIYTFQLNEIITVTSILLNTLKNGFANVHEENYFLHSSLPVLFGLFQSMARYQTTEESFFCYVFPAYKSCISIIYNLKKNYDIHNLNLFSSVCKLSDQKCPAKCKHVFRRYYCSSYLPALINVLEIVRELLSEENLTLFDENMYELRKKSMTIGKFFYYNLGELLKSVCIILLKDLFCYQKNLSTSLINNIKDFTEDFCSALQKSCLLIFDQKHVDFPELTFQKFKINVLTNITCLELLSWAINDKNDAEDLCMRVIKLLNNRCPDQLMVINAPLMIACFDTLGNLAARFPGVASTCVNIIRDFLSLPSPNLTKLCHEVFLSYGDDSEAAKVIAPSKTAWFEHCIFKKLQFSAIENICTSLQVTYKSDCNYIASFLTSFSCLLYLEKFHPYYALVTENVVVTLGHLSFSVPAYSKSILQCFQQRLCRHSVESDIAIIHQLGNLIILSENEGIFLETMKIFSNLLLEINSDLSGELKHISDILFLVLTNVAEKSNDESKIVSVFIRFLEMFVQAGLEDYQCSEVSVIQKSPLAKHYQDKLLQIVSLLAKKLPLNFQFKKQQERLFQDFWLYFVLSKDTIYSRFCEPSLKDIASKLPPLNSESLTDHDLREFFYMSSFNKGNIPSVKQHNMKAELLNFLQPSADIIGIINRLTFPQLVYSHSVCSLEIIRIESSGEPTIEPLFSYLTNQKLQKDKYGMWQCVCKIIEKVFNRFLFVLSKRERNDAREIALEKQAQFLLIHFNNINPQIRHIADKFLSDLIDRFPHLLWNRQVLWSLLDILAILFYSLQINPNDEITSLDVPYTNYTIYLTDTNKLREDIFNDFAARSQEIVSEAKKWAPAIVHSHLQEYILQKRCQFPDEIRSFTHHAWTLLCSNQASNVFEISNILTSISIRSQYIGEVYGCLEQSKIPPIEFGNNLSKDVWKACEEHNLSKYERALLRAAAFSVSQSSMQYEIKQVLATSHIKFFIPEAMTIAVQCWNWICTVLPKFELDLLIEIFLAWQFTIDKKIGLFSVQNKMSCCSTGSRKKSELCNHSEPHKIWVQFITQVIEGTKYSSQEKLELLLSFFHKTLPMSIGGTDCNMMRDIDNLTARFTLLTSILDLLQSDISMTRFNKVIIRQRIYCTCLDYFCSSKKFPRKSGKHLKSHIEVLIKFWHVLYVDKKYILKASAGGNSDQSVESKQYDNMSETISDDILEGQHNQTENMKTLEVGGVQLENSFFPDFKKKRKLSLCLVAEEIEFLIAWYNPRDNTNLTIPGEDIIRAWQTKFFSVEKSGSDIAKIAWEISPLLAVHLPQQIKRDSNITREISELILLDPASVSHIPHAAELLATVENVQKDCKALIHLLSWAKASPTQALSLLSQEYPPHPIILKYASKTLFNCDVGVLLFCVPQLVQCLRHDPLGYVAELIKASAQKSPLLCHQIIWNMKSNMYTDINMTKKSSLYNKLNALLNIIVENLSELEKKFYLREFQFINQITEVSSQIPRNLRQEERKTACLKALSKIKVKPGCYLPSNPEALIFKIDYKSGTPLQSKTRTPYSAKFQVACCSFEKVTEIGLQVSQQELAGFPVDDIVIIDSEINSLVWQPTIFKAGDDVRQDILALQVIKLLEQLYDRIGLDVFLFPYNVTTIAPGMGIIECVPNANSRDQLGKRTNVGLYDYFITRFGDEKSTQFRDAQRNFIKSVAGYSVVNFLLQIKDRHNGNILVDDKGHIIHIDFGFMFESSPGGNLGFEPDMKLTEEMVMIMGRKMESEPFRWFTELCVKAFLAARSRQEDIVSLVTLMLDSGLPCFRGQTIKLLRGRFAPNSSDKEAADYIITVIRNSFLNFRTVTYDMLQYLQNSIQY